eukprot:155831_1
METMVQIIDLVSRQHNITTIDDAINYLSISYSESSPHTLAMFLQQVPSSEGFTRKDISMYLSVLSEDDPLFIAYFGLIDFDGVRIDDSLRLFFTTLKLKPLMNMCMMNVLLSGLATAFIENGGCFEGDISDCIELYEAMIALDASLNDTNNMYAFGRAKWTETHFLEIVNSNNEFNQSEIRNIFQSIRTRPLTQTQPVIPSSNAPVLPSVSPGFSPLRTTPPSPHVSSLTDAPMVLASSQMIGNNQGMPPIDPLLHKNETQPPIDMQNPIVKEEADIALNASSDYEWSGNEPFMSFSPRYRHTKPPHNAHTIVHAAETRYGARSGGQNGAQMWRRGALFKTGFGKYDTVNIMQALGVLCKMASNDDTAALNSNETDDFKVE